MEIVLKMYLKMILMFYLFHYIDMIMDYIIQEKVDQCLIKEMGRVKELILMFHGLMDINHI